MTQKLKTIIFATALTALAACSDDVATGRYSVGEEDNLVRLSTGVQSAPSTALPSRADVSAATHYALQTGTALNLYVEGDWAIMGGQITKTPIYKADAASDGVINPIRCYMKDGVLYWDDFGTADPNNKDASDNLNRNKGLGILAVAIDGITNTTVVNLGNLIHWDTFTVDCDLTTNIGTFEFGGKKFLKKDIIIANNLYHTSETTPQKRYTFDEQKVLGTNPAEARLEFQHVLSKVTFNVTAGQGFSLLGSNAFLDYPTIYLTRNKTGETAEEWCYKKGTIDIKAATATHDGSTLGSVLLNPILKDGSIYTEAAIIYPGSSFGGNNDVIAKINADGNIYYVTAEKIRDAIDALVAGNTSHEHYNKYETLPGYNYIFNITLNKTDVVVTATITDWKTVTAAPVEPKIVVSAEVGKEDDKTKKLTDFRFYRNADGASEQGKYTALADADNPETNDIADGTTTWKFYEVGTSTETSLYWPNHSTHYFFRGVYPSATTVTEGGGTSSYIAVNNAKYVAATFPSDLMIGAPEIASGTKCDNPDHTPVDMSAEGICARTGAINLNFKYMMSQVEVVLKTTKGNDKVELNDQTKLELTNTICSRNIYLGTRAIGNEPGITRQPSYTMNMKGTATAEQVTFHDAIVPQYLPKPNEDKPMRFKVTIKNSNGTYDVYYADVQPIQVSESGGAKKTIENWLGGYHYKYTLTLKKTGISVTATITDWIPANGSDNVWM